MPVPIKFDLASVPESHRMVLLSVIHAELSDFYRQPGVEEAFQRWLRDREQKILRKEEKP